MLQSSGAERQKSSSGRIPIFLGASCSPDFPKVVGTTTSRGGIHRVVIEQGKSLCNHGLNVLTDHGDIKRQVRRRMGPSRKRPQPPIEGRGHEVSR